MVESMNNNENMAKLPLSVSITVPALNEAGNIENTVKNVIQALEKHRIIDFEILIIDDGSTDGTGKIIDDLGVKNSHIRVFHNRVPKGLGYNFRMGANAASKDYVGWFPGDNEILPESIRNILAELGKADMIIPYIANQRIRSRYRRVLSHTYVFIFNAIFGLRLKYFNGTCFFKRELLKTVSMITNSPAYMAEILVQLIKNGKASYIEVPFYMKERTYGKSGVLKWKNVYPIAKTIISVFFQIYFAKSKEK